MNTENSQTIYRGRFAPSPTGPLHFGSLLAAMGSYLQAKQHHGSWLVRIEDVDTPRTIKGASDDILRTLEAYGFEWDEQVVFQSQRTEAYESVIQTLADDGHIYHCNCSRKDIMSVAPVVETGPVYPGTCRDKKHINPRSSSIRVRTHNQPITFKDAIQGTLSQEVERETGDFVIKRADGLYAYQLAVVVDDAWQGITEVVRGYDLFVLTPRQILLQQLLSYPTPTYAHLPVASHQNGEKLSKQTGAHAIPITGISQVLCHAMQFYNQQPPPGLEKAPVHDFWQWAIESWRLSRIPPLPHIPFSESN